LGPGQDPGSGPCLAVACRDGELWEERRVEVIRVPGGGLFWVLISVVLSVVLTALANLVLYLF
jgi:hypothetical protein